MNVYVRDLNIKLERYVKLSYYFFYINLLFNNFLFVVKLKGSCFVNI